VSVSYDPPRAEAPDPYDSFFQPRERPADVGRHAPVPGPRSHDAGLQLPDPYADPRHRPVHRDDYTQVASPRVAGRDGNAVPTLARSSARPGRNNAAMTAAASFWYVLGCIAMGAMYFGKVPVKKALQEAGLATMTSAEQFWYVLQCIFFGAGYFAKLPAKKALTEASLQSGY
jgi:hypothetical protein